MISEEEIRLKLGLDTKEIDEGTRRALQKVVEFGKHSEKAFYEHGEKPARAFHKVLHQLTEQFPLLGGAARIALSPIGGTLAVAVTAAVAFNENLKKIHEMLDRIDKITSKPTGNIFAAMRTAVRGNAADRRRGEAETEELEDSLGESIRTARTAAQRQALLLKVLAARRAAEGRVTEYNSNYSGRDASRLKISKGDESIKALEGQLEQVKAVAEETRGTATTWERAKSGGLFEKSMAGLEFGMTAGESVVGKKVNEIAEAAIPKLRAAIEKEAARRDALAKELDDEADAHKTDVDKLNKYTEAREKILEEERRQSALQSAYDRQLAVAGRHLREAKDAPFTPGLGELSGYSGPYAFIAREVLAGRDLAKRQAGFSNRGEFASL
jgi:hypothetical protein